MAKQSYEDRLKRLQEGRCPVHGLPLVDPCDTAPRERGRRVVGFCQRGDCDISAHMQEAVSGPLRAVVYVSYTLLPQHQHVLDDAPRRLADTPTVALLRATVAAQDVEIAALKEQVEVWRLRAEGEEKAAEMYSRLVHPLVMQSRIRAQEGE
jgi:hypothetical protein